MSAVVSMISWLNCLSDGKKINHISHTTNLPHVEIINEIHLSHMTNYAILAQRDMYIKHF